MVCKVKSISGTGFFSTTALEMWPSMIAEGALLRKATVRKGGNELEQDKDISQILKVF